ncbi:MAG: permease [Solirubrobacteraceae bacterium]
MSALEVIWHGLRDSLLMAWEVWWALVLGFAISAIVQAWVPRERVRGALSGSGPRPVALATGLGAASSSCSYAAVAIARSLFAKGASSATSLAFQFASTNLVWELGLVLWVLIGWQFTLAEYLGGVVMIALMALALRLFVPAALEARAREHAQNVKDDGHHHHHGHDHGHHDHAADHHGHDHPAADDPEHGWRGRVTSRAAWAEVAGNFRMDWAMVYKEIALGFLLAGFIAQLSHSFFEGLFIVHAPAPWPAIESAVVGPLIAVASFVCSIGNVPLAAVLWSGGIGFAGVLAFLFADLIVLPIILIYRKYYGRDYALRTVALMYCTMVLAALIIAALFSLLGLITTGPRPSTAAVFGKVALDYKLVLNVLAALIFIALLRLGTPGSSASKRDLPRPVGSAVQ